MVIILYKESLRNYGFDHFFGRRIDGDSEDLIGKSIENEFFSRCYSPYNSLIDLCKGLAKHVTWKQHILLSKSPGGTLYTPEETISWEPLSKNQMRELERLYELIIETKTFQNPFLY